MLDRLVQLQLQTVHLAGRLAQLLTRFEHRRNVVLHDVVQRRQTETLNVLLVAQKLFGKLLLDLAGFGERYAVGGF